jgi:UDP-glucose 4-epimerase
MTTPRPSFDSALVTGVAGYIGSALVHHLLGEGVAVVGLDRLSRGRPAAVPITVPIVRGDVRDADAVSAAIARLSRPPEVVFHLAGAARIAESVRDPQRFMDINATGTQVVVDGAVQAGVQCVVLASTAAVLAPAQRPLAALDEDSELGPSTPYGHSKLAAERTVAAAASTGRVAAVIARLFNPAGAAYGCAERHEPETHLIPLAIQAAHGLRGPLKVFGDDHATPDGTCVRDYVHIRDVCQALYLGAAKRLERHRQGFESLGVLHVASGQGRSVMEVIAAVGEATGLKVPWELADRRPGDASAMVGCSVRLAIELGFTPSTDLVAMVADAAAALALDTPNLRSTTH